MTRPLGKAPLVTLGEASLGPRRPKGPLLDDGAATLVVEGTTASPGSSSTLVRRAAVRAFGQQVTVSESVVSEIPADRAAMRWGIPP